MGDMLSEGGVGMMMLMVLMRHVEIIDLDVSADSLYLRMTDT